MPRNITVFFSDGTAHQYNNAPDVLTPDDIEKRTKRDYPDKKIIRIDGGRSQSNSQQNNLSKDQDPTRISNLAGIKNTSNKSKFSIKGIRFGMNKKEILAIINPSADPEQIAWSDLFHNNNNFSIAGISYWFPNSEEIGPDNNYNAEPKEGLQQLYIEVNPEEWSKYVRLFSNQYGKPQLSSEQIGNRMGWRGINHKAYWKVQDAHITIQQYTNRLDSGYIEISSDYYQSKENEKYQNQYNKDKKDF